MRGHTTAQRSSEALEERDDSLRIDIDPQKTPLHPEPAMFSPENVAIITTPHGHNDLYKTSSSTSASATPMTAAITPMTPSPLPSPARFNQRHSSSPAALEGRGTDVSTTSAEDVNVMGSRQNTNSLGAWASPPNANFSRTQQGFLTSSDDVILPEPAPSRQLFADSSDAQLSSVGGRSSATSATGPRQSWSTMDQSSAQLSSRRHRSSHLSVKLDDQHHPQPLLGISERRRSSVLRGRNSPNSGNDPTLASSSAETSPSASPKVSEVSSLRHSSSRISVHRRSSSGVFVPDTEKRQRSRQTLAITWIMVFMTVSSAGMIWFMNASLAIDTATENEMLLYMPTRHDLHHHHSDAGLRGKLVQSVGRHELKNKKDDKRHKKDKDKKKASTHKKKNEKSKGDKKAKESKRNDMKDTKTSTVAHRESLAESVLNKNLFGVALPPKIKMPSRKFESTASSLYSTRKSLQHGSNRVVILDESIGRHPDLPHHRRIKNYPADFTDNTQLYSILDSSDERLSHMEMRKPYSDGECVPMKDWQTTFYPVCNGMHELGVEYLGEENGEDTLLFGTKGYWRNAWKLAPESGSQTRDARDTVVLKTLRFVHNFEDAHFEHDRIDAVAMERLTASPHVISAYGFCGHSVLTEYADGVRLGELADKSKRKPLVRLKIARDIADGLADVHGIDGDGNNTFVHLDVNPANVVSVGGRLKLNDFNIGIMRKWNTTSNTPCGFGVSEYPNPQWRSPEEAREEKYLTEKVDVFSMGHIFFRLICGHEPWNKLEPGGKPPKEVIHERVKNGELPFIPEFVLQTTDPEVIAIREAMMKCYTYDPLQRPSARAIARELDAVLEKLSRERGASS